MDNDTKSDPARELQKEVVKEAIKEWLSEQVTAFGWVSLKTLIALAIAGVLYLALVSQGWHK